jgi:putative nucleotidyltransferase with HDIG domain
LLIPREPNDLDILVCSKDKKTDGRLAGINFSKILAKKYNLEAPKIFKRFGTAKLYIHGEEVEFVMPRKEIYDENSRNPDTELGTLEEDCLRRDFTINSLFLRLDNFEIVDLTLKGIDDIKNKIIRTANPQEAEKKFTEDPLRILRAIRQSLQLGFEIEKQTYLSIQFAANRINIVSPERIRDELNKILVERCPSKAFFEMLEIGLLDKILPEAAHLKNLEQPKKYHCENVFNHTLKVLDRNEPDLILRMSALLHDIGKFNAYKKENDRISFHGHEHYGANLAMDILKRLKYDKIFIQKVINVIQNHMYPKMYNKNWSDSSVRRLIKKCGDDFDAIIKFSRTDFGIYPELSKLSTLEERVEKLKNENLLPPKEELLTGSELIDILKIPAGRWIRTAKKKIEELRIENPKLTKKEAILAIKELLK